MRILFVAMPDSIHVVRWISQIADQGWDIFLFPTYRANLHPGHQNLTFLGSKPFRYGYLGQSVRYHSWASGYFLGDWIERRILRNSSGIFRGHALAQIIQAVKPDIIHSLEFQHGCYLTLRARTIIGNAFPTWIATNWGSDIYLYKKFPEHLGRIRQILDLCNYYSCECQRDIFLAQELGFHGGVLPVLPNAGGIRIAETYPLRSPGLISDRKVIIVKGYQGWSGRALVALEAIRLCKKLLGGYTIVVYSASKDVLAKLKKVAKETGINVQNLPQSSHEEILRMFGKARIYIGLGISDGISTSLLEAMVMGAFPIQSCTACADEWIVDGKSGFIVPPEDPALVAAAIERALTDNPLVNLAAEINEQTVRARLDISVIKPQVVKLYEDVYRARKDK
jgi:glycosyltransferase involved in cell wall biosynthesis